MALGVPEGMLKKGARVGSGCGGEMEGSGKLPQGCSTLSTSTPRSCNAIQLQCPERAYETSTLDFAGTGVAHTTDRSARMAALVGF